MNRKCLNRFLKIQWIIAYFLSIEILFYRKTFPMNIKFKHLDDFVILPNCTLNLVFISKSKDISQFPHFQSSKCTISETFYYIHSGAGKDITKNNQDEKDNTLKNVKIVRVNGLDTGNLFSLALSIYYPSTLVGIFDVDKEFDFPNFLIDEYIQKLGNGYDIVFSNSINPVAFVSHQYIARRFLLYTDIKYSDNSALSILYSFYSCQKDSNYYVFQKERKTNCKSIRLPKEWNCDKSSSPQSGYAVLIPTFKRDYLQRSIESWERQELKPKEIIVVQNRNHVKFDFNKIDKYSQIPVRHVWCTNWNSYFFLTYSVMMFINEQYFIKVDDDYFVNVTNGAKRLYDHIIKNPNTMVSTHGLRNYVGYKFNCSCKVLSKKKSVSKRGDYFSLIVMMYSSSGKIMHRFSLYTYLYAEDVAISLTNAMECGTQSISISKIKSVHVGSKDGLSHSKDEEFKNVQNAKQLFRNTSCYYILNGYRPITWKSFSCNIKNNDFRDIRYPH